MRWWHSIAKARDDAAGDVVTDMEARVLDLTGALEQRTAELVRLVDLGRAEMEGEPAWQRKTT